MSIRIKRVYARRDKQDRKRILVDRLWPRGLTRAKAGVALWLKDIAPSTELRKWFGHDPAKWAEFQARHRVELKERGEQVSVLKKAARKGVVTLLYGAKGDEDNEAAVLRDSLGQPMVKTGIPRVST